MTFQLDLSRKACHVCGHRLERSIRREKEWCTYAYCQLYLIEFTIPYEISEESK